MTDERFQLYEPEGRRKYLSAQERAAFLVGQVMAAHASTRTTQLYDRRRDRITLDEVERIGI